MNYVQMFPFFLIKITCDTYRDNRLERCNPEQHSQSAERVRMVQILNKCLQVFLIMKKGWEELEMSGE